MFFKAIIILLLLSIQIFLWQFIYLAGDQANSILSLTCIGMSILLTLITMVFAFDEDKEAIYSAYIVIVFYSLITMIFITSMDIDNEEQERYSILINWQFIVLITLCVYKICKKYLNNKE